MISDDRRPVHAADGVVLEKYGIKNLPFEEWLADTKASAPEYFAYLGVKGDPVTLMKEYEKALTHSRTNGIHPILYPDARMTLEALASKKLFVVSKHPTSHLRHEAKEYGIAKYFLEILGDIPDKTLAIQNILASHELEPPSALYIGDMIYDIRAGRRAGVITAAVATGYQTRDVLAAEQPDILLDSLSGLLRFAHDYQYVGMDNPFMQAAREYAKKYKSNLAHPAAAVIVKDSEIIGVGSIGSNSYHINGCERVRLHMPTGQGYELCKGCDYIYHSESRAISDATHSAQDADLYLWGHWWCCEPCWKAMRKACIRTVYLLKDSEILFNKSHPDNIVGRQFDHR